MAIKVLNQVDHIQQRPSMYIGSTTTPEHLLIELIDNATDELLNSKGSLLIVEMNNGVYSVQDDGRGIPIRQKNIKNDIPIVLATQLFSGGKFDSEMYVVKTGLHGIGLTVVNALSKRMLISITTKSKTINYEFRNSKFISKKILKERHNYSTKIEFEPDDKYFTSTQIDKSKIIQKLQVVKTILPNIKIYLRIDSEEIEIKDNIIQSYFETQPIKFEYKKDKYKLTVFMGMSETTRPQATSVVNGLLVPLGNHIQSFLDLLRTQLYKNVDKRHIQKNNLLVRTKTLLILQIPDELSFSSQTKERLVIQKEKLEPIINQKVIAKLVNNNGTFFDDVIDIARKYSIELASKKLKIKRSKVVAIENLRDCTSDDIERRELFLLEGESAGGTLQLVRDVKYHAILPLRGKIINAIEHSHNKILKSEVVQNLIKTIGIQPFSNNLSSLRYNKIIILTDADDDGKHITTLLLTFFYVVSKQLIKSGHLYIVEPPLYGAYKNGKFIAIYEHDRLKKYKTFSRFKGLGEMQPNEIYEIAISDKRRLVKVSLTKPFDIEKLWRKIKGKGGIDFGYSKS